MKDTCVDCDVGYYKDTIGDGACTKCPDGTSTRQKGSTVASHCGNALYCIKLSMLSIPVVSRFTKIPLHYHVQLYMYYIIDLFHSHRDIKNGL